MAQWLEEDDELTDDGAAGPHLRGGRGGLRKPRRRSGRPPGIDMRQVEKQLMLQVLDQKWKEHLSVMDHLRQGIHLRAYAQKQPKQEYKRESFALFQELQGNINRDVIRLLSRIQIASESEIEDNERRRRQQAARRMNYNQTDEDAPAEARNGAPRRGAAAAGGDLCARRAQGRPQRALSLRFRQEVQAVLREALTWR